MLVRKKVRGRKGKGRKKRKKGKKEKKQVTPGHNIVVDRWAGAFNPQPDPCPKPPPTRHAHTKRITNAAS